MRAKAIPPVSRRAANIAGCILLSIAIGILATSCRRKVMTNEEASLWVAAYTPAHIDCDATVRIELTDTLISLINPAADLDDAVKLSPSVKGEVKLSDDMRYLDFIPSESMTQGKQYECRVNIGRIAGRSDLGEFDFTFTVERRAMSLKDVKATVDADDTSMMTITGRIDCNVAPTDSITGGDPLVSCPVPGAKVTFENAGPTSRIFHITGLKRSKRAAAVDVTANPMSGFAGENVTVSIPAIDDFTLISAEATNAPEPYITLEFSAPLSSQQELDGLITIDGIPDLRFDRNGATVRVYYPSNSIPDMTLRVSDMVKNGEGRKLNADIERHFEQEIIPPAVEIPIEGNILPDNANLRLPFRAVNLAAVDVEVVEIFPSNVMSFLSGNELNDNYGPLRRFGRLIYRQTVRLDGDKDLDLHKWQNFSIDLNGLFHKERNAVYSVRITFRKAYSLYGKTEAGPFELQSGVTADDKKTWDRQSPYIYRDAPDYDWDKYKWSDCDNPLTDSYYMDDDRMPERRLVASNLGLIAKTGADNSIHAIVTNIMNAVPVAGAEVTAYNYQLQKLASATTDANGFATLRTDGRPFMIIAGDGSSKTYLKVSDYNALSTSNFDVSGKTVGDGIKGFVYGERGVWRPGDNMHLTLIVDDSNSKLPEGHPVVMELYTPSEQLYSRQTMTQGIDGFYAFDIATGDDAPTGAWSAKFKVGNVTFTHPVRVETIKPNRLKVNIGAPEVLISNRPDTLSIDARWLTGAVAKDLNAKLEMTLYPNPTPFKKYSRYTFNNPLVTSDNTTTAILDGKLDSIGHIEGCRSLGSDINAPGMLMANLTAKVTEPGGDVSMTSTSVPFSPFNVYAGIDLSGENYYTDTDINFPVVAVNHNGDRLKSRVLEYKIYRLDWDFWYEGGAEVLGRYVKSTKADIVKKDTVNITNGYANIPFKVDSDDWGRYLVIVRDSKGGHATGGVVTVDWPDWEGRADRDAAAAETVLSFKLDKKNYEVGETASLYFPQCEGGRVLISVENGSRVIKKMWAATSADKETRVSLPVDKDMAPNFYVTATLLRPHSATADRSPIRLFGIASADVVDRSSILHPVIEMPDELHPQQQFTLKIKERDNKPMTYTIAIVDEGLLDITNYATPQPWKAMNRHEALGVSTRDIYDDVLGAFGAKFPSVLSIGGDEALRRAAGKEKRFNPVVKFIGPVTLASGSGTHKISLPNYVGSVRVMVVAAHSGSYGSADRTVKVTSPVMLLTTLPRTLAVGDSVTMPVNIFAMLPEIKNVTVDVAADGPVKVDGAKRKTVSFPASREQITSFNLLADTAREGKGRIIVTASGGAASMSDTVYIDVKNPMPEMTQTESVTLNEGSTTLKWTAANTTSVSLQLSSFPSINFSEALKFMENYRHLCSEQLSSKAMFMLFGSKFLTDAQSKECAAALPSLLKAIASRQLPDGGYCYWPGDKMANEWVTSMAGIVMAEAARQGYNVEGHNAGKWAEYQERKAREYRADINTDIVQAYRIYSLASAGKSPKAAMNRLRESKTLSPTAACCLASAYACDGRTDVAKTLVDRAKRSVAASSANTPFYTPLRDKAIKMQALADCGATDEAIGIASEIASECNGSSYVTQDIAFSTCALDNLRDAVGSGDKNLTVTEKGHTPLSIKDKRGVSAIHLSPESGEVSVENNSKSDLMLSLLTTSRAAANAASPAQSAGMQLIVNYTDLNGKPLSIGNLPRDTDFNAQITVINKGEAIDNAALTLPIPSGWEIWNERLSGLYRINVDHSDVRDDKIMMYFHLDAGATKRFTVRLRAAYAGSYLLPPALCEDMYNPARMSATASRRVKVTN